MSLCTRATWYQLDSCATNHGAVKHGQNRKKHTCTCPADEPAKFRCALRQPSFFGTIPTSLEVSSLIVQGRKGAKSCSQFMSQTSISRYFGIQTAETRHYGQNITSIVPLSEVACNQYFTIDPSGSFLGASGPWNTLRHQFGGEQAVCIAIGQSMTIVMKYGLKLSLLTFIDKQQQMCAGAYILRN